MGSRLRSLLLAIMRREVCVLLVAVACRERDPVSSIDRARSAAFSAPSAVASSPPSVPATPVSESAETRWDEELVAEAAPWTALHSSSLWRLAESFSHQLADFDDRGCGGTLRPGERLGAAIARQRRAARKSKHYSEDVRCVPRQIGYECSIHFGLNGTDDDRDFGIGVSMSVRPDGSLLDSKVVCYWAG
jgi:hypothetical protein